MAILLLSFPPTVTNSTGIPSDSMRDLVSRGSSSPLFTKSEMTTILPLSSVIMLRPSSIAELSSVVVALGFSLDNTFFALDILPFSSAVNALFSARMIVLRLVTYPSAFLIMLSKAPPACILADASRMSTVCPDPMVSCAK